MENTVAFDTLMQLISVLGSFVTTPLFFGLSVLNILVISFIFNMVIGVCLGGISPRLLISRENVNKYWYNKGQEDLERTINEHSW